MDRPWFAFYDNDVPRTIEYPKVSLKELFNRNAENNPDRPYLVMGDLSLPYRACNDMARGLANGLISRGVRKGDRIALLMPNIPQYPLTLMACFKAGAIAVPANPLYTVPELAFMFSDSGAETAVVMAPFAGKAIQILKEGNTPLRRVITVQTPGKTVELENTEGLEDYGAMVATSDAHGEPDVAVYPEDIAMLQYTGGTTGFPKGCMLSHANLVAMGEQTFQWGKPGCPAEFLRTLAAIPLFHIFGMNCNINLTLQCAGTMVLVVQPTPDNIVDAANRHDPNVWAAVPTMIQGVSNYLEARNSGFFPVGMTLSGGAPLHVEVMRQFERLSGSRVFEGYGMSETSNVIAANPYSARKPGSVGVPLPDVEIRVVDMETGTREMPPDSPGEIIARGPQIMSGYWNNPEETAKTLRNGWLYTGDIGTMDRDGYLYLLDRKKDLIICSGFNVFPREVDEVLYTCPKVSEACVIGVPDEKRGETVKAYLALKTGEIMTSREVMNFCAERLAPYKVPKMVEFITELPRTSYGKPDRRKLREIDREGRKQ